MSKDYNVFCVHRMFKEDVNLIEKCYMDYNYLHFNPTSDRFIERVFAKGSFWGIFCGEKIVSISYLIPFNEIKYENPIAYWEIDDLLTAKLDNYLFMGYLWQDEEYKNVNFYNAFCKLFDIQRQKYKKDGIIYCLCAHFNIDMNSLFDEKFYLKGLRGLDKLVPHYIFVKEYKEDDKEKNITEQCSIENTKQVSKLCEQGYKGVKITEDKIISFVR